MIPLALTNLNPTEVSNPSPVTTTGEILKVMTVPRTPSQVVNMEVSRTPRDIEMKEEATAEEINTVVKAAVLLPVLLLNDAALELEANLMAVMTRPDMDPVETRKVATEAVATPNPGITAREAVDMAARTRDIPRDMANIKLAEASCTKPKRHWTPSRAVVEVNKEVPGPVVTTVSLAEDIRFCAWAYVVVSQAIEV